MGTVLGDLLPLVVGVAVSPVPIIVAILMLLGKRAGSTSISFAIGWIAGIVLATTIFVLLGGAATGSEDEPSTTSSWIKLVIGVLLLGVGIRQWRARGEEHATPKWMSAIDEMTAVKALGVGFALAAINPKNLLMCIAAGVTIGGAALDAGQTVVAVAVFSVLSASTIAVPVIAYQIAAQRLEAPLASLKEWLQANNSAVMSVLILVISAVLIGKGMGGLF
ncbi:GAP family protein [Rhodococcus sp. PAMC28707]|uniref:GAP family protein n=1 Tax=unclassified Rhodococcus (in: high G+C Gram-positive bacteria) TaxID=192944 RepID=UPI00109DEAB8|nr:MULTISPECIES: GAP family protein [unclassified Rhodococcus (in: high G+C Gram-positive bacteria)]QCB49532.1 GAP family protein [Rhodococcus sp. PAMC28705]QCB58778.1 GAP family protein [Rhodococcus sp. PAMC28707]